MFNHEKQVLIKKMNLEGDILTIKVGVSKEFGPSASGKTIIIATTEGNVVHPGLRGKEDWAQHLHEKNACLIEWR